MRDYYLGLDNGISGNLGIIGPDNKSAHHKTPIKKVLNYTKEKAWINRISTPELKTILQPYADANAAKPGSVLMILERAMVNPKRWKASMSAIRALEATLIVIEELGIPYVYVDSKEWQRVMLPASIAGDELKPASKQVAERLFPNLTFKSDGDGILIAEWARRKQL